MRIEDYLVGRLLYTELSIGVSTDLALYDVHKDKQAMEHQNIEEEPRPDPRPQSCNDFMSFHKGDITAWSHRSSSFAHCLALKIRHLVPHSNQFLEVRNGSCRLRRLDINAENDSENPKSFRYNRSYQLLWLCDLLDLHVGRAR